MRGSRAFVGLLLLPALFFLVMFYVYPTIFNLQNSFTDLSLFGLKRGRPVDRARQLRRAHDQPRVPPRALEYRRLADLRRRVRAHRPGPAARAPGELGHAPAVAAQDALPRGPARALGDAADRRGRRLALDARPASGRRQRAAGGLGLVDRAVAFLSDVTLVWPALITIITWNTLPLVTLTFLASLKAIPAELLEAASVDGATQAPERVARGAAPPHAGRRGHDAHVDLLDLQQLRLRLADHGRRARPLHERHGDRGVPEGVRRRPHGLQLGGRHRHGRDHDRVRAPLSPVRGAARAHARSSDGGRGRRAHRRSRPCRGPGRAAPPAACPAGEILVLAVALVSAVVLVYPTAWVFFASFKTRRRSSRGSSPTTPSRTTVGCSRRASASTSSTALSSACRPCWSRRSCRCIAAYVFSRRGSGGRRRSSARCCSGRCSPGSSW